MRIRAARRTGTIVPAVALFGLCCWFGLHVIWALSTEVNWDEFALLARASDSLREGRLLGGGRPGLATLLLMPIVRECADALSTVRVARLWWTPFSAGILLGLWLVLTRLFSDREKATLHALIGVALLALTPNFMRFVVQVRTDQPAIALGLLAGGVLLSSRHSWWVSASAGALLGAGYLFSQKLVYVAALVGLLVLGDLVRRRDLQVGREVTRAIIVVAGFVLTLAVFRGLVTLLLEAPVGTNLGSQMDVFSFYREGIGRRYYRQMLPGLIAPLGLLSIYVAAVPGALARGGLDRMTAMLSLSVLGLGLAVALFHAGAFPYFWMTLGLYPAVALAIGLPLLRHMPEWVERVAYPTLLMVFFVTAGSVSVIQLRDGQSVQRETMQFVDANIADDLQGFHTTRALFCRDGVDPLPTFFSQTIRATFSEDHEGEKARKFIAEFSRRPIAYVVQSFRMEEFPASVRRFWADHYIPYMGAVHLHGTYIKVPDSTPLAFQVLVPSYYSLYGSDGSSRILIDSTRMAPGDSIWLEAGTFEIDRSEVGGPVLIALSVPTPPGQSGDTFYRVF